MQSSSAGSHKTNAGSSTAPSSSVVHELEGYKSKPWCLAVFVLLTVLTGGLAFALACFVYWLYPQLSVYTLRPSSLDQADYVLCKLINGHQKLIRVSELRLPDHQKMQDITGMGWEAQGSKVRVFVLMLTLYVFSSADGTFEPLPSMPPTVPYQILNAQKALRSINKGAPWAVFNPVSTWPRQQRAALYGRNDMAAGKPNIFVMAAQLLAYPLYLVQYVELAFTAYERYYYYSAILASITIISAFGSTAQLYHKRVHLFKSVAQRHLVPIVQAGHVRPVSSHRLVPGDVVVLLRGKATCDMVLLQGSCLVEESMLSGEAAQVRKTSFMSDGGLEEVAPAMYNPDVHHASTIHAGTFVQQVWNEAKADEEVLAMVVRTGLCTTMGNMLRQVVAPLNTVDLFRDPFIRDVLRYCSFAAMLQLGSFMLYASRASRHPHDALTTFRHVADFFVSSVSPGIPTVLIFSLFRCVVKLRQRDIDVLQTVRIKSAAAVTCLAFDKTGTLTESLPEFHGMLPVLHGNCFAELQQTAAHWPNGLRQCAAVCNNLNRINKYHLVGDAADFKAFNKCEARFVDRNHVSLPLKQRGRSRSSHITTLTILKRFDFQPHLLRSGVIAVDSSGAPDEALLFVRGAPSAIEEVIGRDRTPSDYQQVIDDYSGKSFRLLAMAKGVLKGFDQQALMLMSQEQLERRVKSYELLGLLVLSNHLRSDSINTIAALHQQGGLRTLMVTGDYHHTALAVARGVGMIASEGQVIIIQKASESTRHTRRSSGGQSKHSALKASDRVQSEAQSRIVRGVSFAADLCRTKEREYQGLLFHLDSANPADDDATQALIDIAAGEVQCCVTGSAFEHMLQLGDLSLLETVMRNVVVFSRMKPHQKGQVMDLLSKRGLHRIVNNQQQHLPGLGETCMYCGDGINDLIALAAADVGVAIGAGDVSAAAAISTKHCSVAGLVTVLREARAAQTIKLAAIKFMVLYQLLLALMFHAAFFMDGSGFTAHQRALLDVMALSLGMVCSLRPANEQLTRNQPAQVLCRSTNFILLAATMALSAIMYWVCMWYMTIQPWYTGGTGTPYQNPITTFCWTCALCQVNCTPSLTWLVDTMDFCGYSSVPEAILLVVNCIFSSVICLVGLAVIDKADFFGFYKFPWAFR